MKRKNAIYAVFGVVFMVALLLMAAPSFQSFVATQFTTDNSSYIAISSGAIVTNLVLTGQTLASNFWANGQITFPGLTNVGTAGYTNLVIDARGHVQAMTSPTFSLPTFGSQFTSDGTHTNLQLNLSLYNAFATNDIWVTNNGHFLGTANTAPNQTFGANNLLTGTLGDARYDLLNSASSNITDSGYTSVARNLQVNTNANISTLTVTNPATFQNGLTNALGLPSAVAVYGANTNLVGLANASGVLTNNGSGTLGYLATANLQTPWAGAINGAANKLTNAGAISVANITNLNLSPSALVATDGTTNQVSVANPANQLGFVAWNGSNPVFTDPALMYGFIDEMDSGSSGQNIAWSVSSSSGGFIQGQATGVGHPGVDCVLQIFPTNSSSGESIKRMTFIHGSGSSEFLQVICESPNVLSTGTSLYAIDVGFHDASVSAFPVDGCFFHYDSTTNVWMNIVGKASTYTTNFTSITNSINTFYKFWTKIDANTNMLFYINGTPVYTNSTPSSVPTAAIFSEISIRSTTSGGSAVSISLHVDEAAMTGILGATR